MAEPNDGSMLCKLADAFYSARQDGMISRSPKAVDPLSQGLANSERAADYVLQQLQEFLGLYGAAVSANNVPGLRVCTITALEGLIGSPEFQAAKKNPNLAGFASGLKTQLQTAIDGTYISSNLPDLGARILVGVGGSGEAYEKRLKELQELASEWSVRLRR